MQEMREKEVWKEVWRKNPGDYYSPSIQATADGKIRINIGGHVITKSIEEWDAMPSHYFGIDAIFPRWFYKLGLWLFFRKS